MKAPIPSVAVAKQAGRLPVLLFVALALVGGLALVALYPPMQVPDEGSHFARAYQVSEGGMLPLKRGKETGGILPTSIIQLLQMGDATSWHAEARIENPIEIYRDLLQNKLEPASRSFAAFPKTTSEPPLAFLPQAAGIRIARLVSASALVPLYGARLANLLVAILCTAVAISVTPIYKWVFAWLALSPLVLAEMASATGYALTYGVVFLFVAVVLRLAFGGQGMATWIPIVILLILAVATSLVIQGYLPLLLLYFVVPAARVGGRKRYWLTFTALCLVAGGTTVAWHFAQAPTYSPPNAGVDPAAQFRLLSQNSRHFFGALRSSMGLPPIVHVMSTPLSGLLLTGSLSKPGFLIVLRGVMVPVCAGLVIVACFLDACPAVGRVSLRQRLVAFLVGVASVLAIFLIVYVQSMPVGGTGILVRPRQLIPCGLALLLCLVNLTPRLGKFGAFARSYFGTILVVYFLLRFGESGFSMWARYYS